MSIIRSTNQFLVPIQDFGTNRSCLLYLLFTPILFLSCSYNQRANTESKEFPQDSLLIFSENWMSDSLGCHRMRDAEKIAALIEQMNLIGKDTSSLIKYLGKPNFKERIKDKIIYYYYLECGEKGKTSYDNFYCHFRGDSLLSYQRKTF